MLVNGVELVGDKAREREVEEEVGSSSHGRLQVEAFGSATPKCAEWSHFVRLRQEGECWFGFSIGASSFPH